MSDGAVFLKVDGGQFRVLNGTVVYEEIGGGPQVGIPDAPAAALYALCLFLIDCAWAASNACGGGNVAGATAACGWAMLTSSYAAAQTDLEYLADCVARGMGEPLPE